MTTLKPPTIWFSESLRRLAESGRLPTEAEVQARARAEHEANEMGLEAMRQREWGLDNRLRSALRKPMADTDTWFWAREFLATRDTPARDTWALVLWGGTGCGKTLAAAWWLTQAARVPVYSESMGRSWTFSRSARFIAFSALVEALGSFDPADKALVNEARTASHLVLDDVGSECKAGAAALENVIAARHSDMKPTVITTNLECEPVGQTPALFQRRYGDRVWSRLHQGGFIRGCGATDLRMGGT